MEHRRVDFELVVDARQFLALKIEQRQVVDLDNGGMAAYARTDQAGDEHRARYTP